MATTFKWTTAETASAYFNTELNALANNGYASPTWGLPQDVDLYQYMSVEFVSGSVWAPTKGGYLEVDIFYQVGTAYAATGYTIAVLPFEEKSASHRTVKTHIPLAPHSFKLGLRNKAGAALPDTKNTLNFSRYYDQGV